MISRRASRVMRMRCMRELTKAKTKKQVKALLSEQLEHYFGETFDGTGHFADRRHSREDRVSGYRERHGHA